MSFLHVLRTLIILFSLIIFSCQMPTFIHHVTRYPKIRIYPALLVSPDRQHYLNITDVNTQNFVIQSTTDNKAVLVLPRGPTDIAKFSPDGRYIVIGRKGTVEFFDIRSGRLEKKIRGNFGKAIFFAVSPNNSFLAVADSTENWTRVEFYDAKTGSYLMTIGNEKTIYSFAFSYDERYFAFGHSNSVVILNLRDIIEKIYGGEGITPTTFERVTRSIIMFTGNNVRAIVFSKDSRLLAIGTEDSKILIFNAETGSRIKQLKGLVGIPIHLVFSLGGKYLAAGSVTNEIVLWNVESGMVEKSWQFKKTYSLVANNIDFDWDGKVTIWKWTCSGISKLTWKVKPEFLSFIIHKYTSPRDYTRKGINYYNKKDYLRAGAYFFKAITIDSEYQPAYLWLGMAYKHMSKYEKALQMFKKTIQIAPDTQEAYIAKKQINKLRSMVNK